MNRLLFVPTNRWTDWGGSEKLWAYVAKRLLSENAAKIGILTRKWEPINPALRDLFDASEVFQYCAERPVFYRLIAKVTDQLHLTVYREQIFLRAVSRLDPNLVVVSQGSNTDGLQWMEFCGKHKIPYVTISQAASEAVWLHSSEAERLAVALLKARRNFFVSRDNLRLTELQVGSRLPNSSVIPNPYDVPYDACLDYPSAEPNFRLACVARFELHAKGQDVLFETLSDPKWKRRNIAVGLYGNGNDRLHVEKLIRLFELQDSVRIMGFLPPVEIWKTNHALVLPSRYEGLPLALVEAMLCGRIGIVTNVSGNAEVIEDNVNGFIAEAPRAVYLDSALDRAWAMRAHWEALGQDAKKFIKGVMPPDPVADFANTLMTLM